MSKKKGTPVREPLSNTSVVLFIVLFAANLLAALPAIIRPTSAQLDNPDPVSFIAPAVLYTIVVAVATFTLRKKTSTRWKWVRWVAFPSVGLTLCVISMFALWFSIPLAIYAGISLLGQIVIMSRYGYTGNDNPLG